MTFEQFKKEVQENILNFLPEEYRKCEVECNEVRKNNGIVLTGLMIKGEGNVYPTIYLEQYHDMFERKNDPMDRVMSRIANTYLNSLQDTPAFQVNDFTYENLKDKLYYVVVNAEKNEELLKNCPHDIKEDLAILYKVQITDNQNQGIGSILLNHAHLQKMQVSEAVMKQQARENMPKILPPVFRDMNVVLAEMMGMANMEGMELPEEMPSNEMWVLSNDSNIQGASYMFDEKTMDMIAEKLKGDFVILPSSIHETLILKVNETMDLEDLKEMVNEVNRTQVQPDEVLSDSVYRYDSKSKELTIATDFEQTQGMNMGM